MWKYRERLTYYEKVRRSLYEILRDALETRLMKVSLIDSFFNFQKSGVEYSFVDKSELKPKSKKMEKESDLFKTFIVIFCEGSVSPELKNYLRFFPENAVVKKNIEYLANFSLYKNFQHNMRYFDNPGFFDLIDKLLDVDYALLIQPDASIKKITRYCLTHLHVKLDWPIADAATDLAKWLRYIQNHLYENGDREARQLQSKLFEYYGCHHSVGGRRTAGLVAAQLLRKLEFISTVYVSSSESRTMYKYSERGLSKFFLIQLTREQLGALAQREGLSEELFENYYLYPAGAFHIGIAEASYSYTKYSDPPAEGKLRRLKPAYNWLKLKDEFLHPKVTAPNAKPLNYNWIYTRADTPAPAPPPSA